MKHAIIPLLLTTLFLLPAHADETPYRAALKSAHARYHALDIQLNDYRKPKKELPAAQEEEYHRILGQLSVEDPVWALSEQIQSDIEALVAMRSRTAEDNATLENLKDLLAVTCTVEERATTREQAEKFATALRQFIARRDVAGARSWARSQ